MKNVISKPKMSRALYIGAGLDLGIVKRLPTIQKFIFCDSQPFSEFGKDVNLNKDGYNTFSRPNFTQKLVERAEKEGMKLSKVEGDKISFHYPGLYQDISYYINTSIPEDMIKIAAEIRDFDSLIVKGHHPNYAPLLCTTKLKNVYLSEGTSYVRDDSEGDTVIGKFYDKEWNPENFYYLTQKVYDEVGMVVPVTRRYKNWDEFIFSEN